MCRITEKCPFPLLPDLTIKLQTSSGETLVEFNTGYVQRVNDPNWKQHRMRFTTPSNVSSVKLVMIDNSPGGCGNDFAIDDITFSEYVKIPVAKATKPVVRTPVKTTKKTASSPQQKPAPTKPTRDEDFRGLLICET